MELVGEKPPLREAGNPAYDELVAESRKATGSDLLTGRTVQVAVEGAHGTADENELHLESGGWRSALE
nr:hypothetical protein OG999_02745 [Streptomyces sp. NBC_00886]